MQPKCDFFEIERKFLIKYPDSALLSAQTGAKVLKIVQHYLHNGGRVRKTECDGETVYYFNTKQKVSDVTHIENEHEITESEFCVLLENADPTLNAITKTRYAIPYAGHLAEIDVYPFWNDRAIVEVELSSEDEHFELPPYITVIREVTHDAKYKNRSLAASVPYESLD